MSVLAAVRQVATRPRDRWTVLWGALLVVVAAHALWHVAVHPPVDLEVYLLGGSTIRSGADNLYAADVVTAEGLPFTYPPFAALLFLPASLIGLRASGLVIGIVSMSDLVTCFREDSNRRGEEGAPAARASWDRIVEDVMSTSVATIAETSSLAEAMKLFAERQVHRLPVVDQMDAVVGVLSVMDLVRWVSRGFVPVLTPER